MIDSLTDNDRKVANLSDHNSKVLGKVDHSQILWTTFVLYIRARDSKCMKTASARIPEFKNNIDYYVLKSIESYLKDGEEIKGLTKEEIQNIKTELLSDFEKWLSSSIPEAKYNDLMQGISSAGSAGLCMYLLDCKTDDTNITT